MLLRMPLLIPDLTSCCSEHSIACSQQCIRPVQDDPSLKKAGQKGHWYCVVKVFSFYNKSFGGVEHFGHSTLENAQAEVHTLGLCSRPNSVTKSPIAPCLETLIVPADREHLVMTAIAQKELIKLTERQVSCCPLSLSICL